MLKKILFNGCSYTAVQWGELGENPEEKRFSKLVSNHFNAIEYNIAEKGSSNDSIVRRTIEWFENGNHCDFAVILLTHEERIEIPVDHKINYYKVSFGRSWLWQNQREKIIDDGFPNKGKLDYEYYKTVYTERCGYHNFYKNKYILKKYLWDKNIPNLVLHYCPTLVKNDDDCIWNLLCGDYNLKYIVDGNPHIVDEIKKMFLQNNASISVLGKMYNEKYFRNPFNDDRSHFNEDGHKVVSDYIIELIQSHLTLSK